MFDPGLQRVQQAGSSRSYYTLYQTTGLYVEKAFGFPAHKISLTNDSEDMDIVDISFDGATLHGSLKAGESRDFFVNGKTSFYVKSQSGTPNVRIWAE